MNMFFKHGLCLVLILSGVSYSQISVKEDVTTDSVNLFTNYEQSAKSSKLAMGLSLVLPGAGHQYLGRTNSALAYMAVDLFSLFGAVYAGVYSHNLDADSRGFAGLLAGANAGKNDNSYWQAVGAYDNLESYNDAMGLNRDADEQYNDGTKYWNWADTSDRTFYNEIRKKARKYQLISSICIGAMALNRVVAIVDIRASSKYKVIKTLSTVTINPSINIGSASAGLVMSARF